MSSLPPRSASLPRDTATPLRGSSAQQQDASSLPLLRRIATRIVLLALVAIAPFLIYIIGSLSNAFEAQRESALRSARDVAMVDAARLDGYIGGIHDLLTGMSLLLVPRMAQPEQLRLQLRELKRRLPDYINAVQVIAPDGTVLASSADPSEARDGYSVADRKYFKQAVTTHGLGVGEPVVSRTTGKLAIAFAKPELDAAGKLLGLVTISIRLENVQALITHAAVAPGAVVTLVNESAKVLGRSDDAPNWVGRDLSKSTSVYRMLQQRSGADQGVAEDGTRQLVGFATAERLPWLIYVSVPERVALAPAWRGLWRLGGLALLTTLLALGLALWLARRVARPIGTLQRDVERLATGDLAHRSSVREQTEVGQLAEQVNRMALNLELNTQELRTSEQRLDQIIRATTDGIWEVDLKNGRVEYSRRVTETLGYTLEELGNAAETFEAHVHPDDVEAVRENLRLHILRGRPLSDEFRVRAKSGEWIWFSRRGQAIRDERGRAQRVVGAMTDVSVRKKAQQEVQRLNAELEERVSARTQELTKEVADHERTQQQLQNVNEDLYRSVRQLRQQARDLALIHEMSEWLQGASSVEDYHKIIAHKIQQIFESRKGALYMLRPSRDLAEAVQSWGMEAVEDTFMPEECWGLKLTKRHVHDTLHGGLACAHMHGPQEEMSVCVPLNSHGETLGLLHLRAPVGAPAEQLNSRLTLVDTVAEYVGLALGSFKLQQAWRFQSIRDALTGLYNRRYMEESLGREQARVVRSGTSLGIIMFDLDGFKQLNDAYGHDAGDEVLRKLGRMLTSQVRGADIACRYGGEEFTVILPGATLDVSRERAELLRQLVAEMSVEAGGRIIHNITISLGVAAFPQHGASWSEVMKAADLALYSAKQAGRNQVCVAPG